MAAITTASTIVPKQVETPSEEEPDVTPQDKSSEEIHIADSALERNLKKSIEKNDDFEKKHILKT